MIHCLWDGEGQTRVRLNGHPFECVEVERTAGQTIGDDFGLIRFRLRLANLTVLDVTVWANGSATLELKLPVPGLGHEHDFVCEVDHDRIIPVLLGDDPAEQLIRSAMDGWWTDVETVEEIQALAKKWGALPLVDPSWVR